MTYEGATRTGSDVDQRDAEPEAGLPPRPAWVYAAFGFTLLYMSIHLYWAVGGTWGLPLLALHDKAAVQAANWVVSGIMLVGAGVVLALNHPRARRVPSWLLLVPVWVGAAVCLSHGVYGFVTKALYLSGRHGAVDFPVVPGVGPATAAAHNHLSAVQDILVFEPCFVIEGALLALAGWQFLRTRAGRRTWTASLVVGIAAVDVFGAVLALGGLHVAVG